MILNLSFYTHDASLQPLGLDVKLVIVRFVYAQTLRTLANQHSGDTLL